VRLCRRRTCGEHDWAFDREDAKADIGSEESSLAAVLWVVARGWCRADGGCFGNCKSYLVSVAKRKIAVEHGGLYAFFGWHFC
jgi:hypothetical protein